MKNNFIKVIIIDDEKLARDLIKNFLQSFNNIQIIAECKDGFEGLKSINTNNPDLVFLDIQMPKLNGFEMLELLEDMPNIIFTTAYDQYALKAFEVNATDYLLKPFSRKRFSDAVEKVIGKINGSNTNKNELPNTFIQTEEKLSRVVVKKNSKIVIIAVEDIVYIEAQDDYVSITTSDGSFLKQNRMKYYEEHLPNSFIRIHRSYIANLNEIKEIALLEKESHIVILKSGEKLPVSKTGYKKLKEIIK